VAQRKRKKARERERSTLVSCATDLDKPSNRNKRNNSVRCCRADPFSQHHFFTLVDYSSRGPVSPAFFLFARMQGGAAPQSLAFLLFFKCRIVCKSPVICRFYCCIVRTSTAALSPTSNLFTFKESNESRGKPFFS
jgi:hypothetical protein